MCSPCSQHTRHAVVQCCAIQAMGKTLETLVLQEHAWWLNLANLSDREKDDILDMPIVPDGTFGSALAPMQRRCKAKKRDFSSVFRVNRRLLHSRHNTRPSCLQLPSPCSFESRSV